MAPKTHGARGLSSQGQYRAPRAVCASSTVELVEKMPVIPNDCNLLPWALLLGIGGLVAGAVVLANKNGYDGNVCRYRDRGGQFRKGPFF